MKLPLSLLLLLLLLLAALTTALTDLHGLIGRSQFLPHPSALPPSTTFTLTTAGSVRRTTLHSDSSFRFRNVPEGSYLLEVICPTHHFAPYRVDVPRDGGAVVHQTFRGNPWSNLGPRMDPATPIVLVPIKAAEYFVVREGFSPLKMLGSPMILIALVSLVGIVFLPKMLDKLDPEFKKELEEQQKKGGAMGAMGANPLDGFDMASFLAGTSSKKPAATGGGGGKKRN